MRPTIAIVGSIDPKREGELELTNVEAAPEAAEALGRALAEHECNIVVYSSAAQFVEAAVVRGYVGSGQAATDSIQVRYPRQDDATFPEMQQHPACFRARPDTSRSWEVSFYRSLFETDGVLLIGGGQSTLVAGLIAISVLKPVVAIAAFGGRAREAWEALNLTKNDATEPELEAMGRGWRAGAEEELVGSLLEQRKRRDAKEAEDRKASDSAARQQRVSLLAGFVLVLAAVAMLVVVQQATPGTTESKVALFTIPVLTGVTGALWRNAVEGGTQWLKTSFIGLVAGAITAVVFIASQLTTSSEPLNANGVKVLSLLVFVIGLIGGATSDKVFNKVREQDVFDAAVVQPKR